MQTNYQNNKVWTETAAVQEEKGHEDQKRITRLWGNNCDTIRMKAQEEIVLGFPIHIQSNYETWSAMAFLTNLYPAWVERRWFYSRRKDFCRWFPDQQWNARFLANFVVGDKAVVSQCSRIPTTRDSTWCYVSQLTVWMGVCVNGSIAGPFFFEKNVDGDADLNILSDNVIPQLIEFFTLLVQN